MVKTTELFTFSLIFDLDLYLYVFMHGTAAAEWLLKWLVRVCLVSLAMRKIH